MGKPFYNKPLRIFCPKTTLLRDKAQRGGIFNIVGINSAPTVRLNGSYFIFV